MNKFFYQLFFMSLLFLGACKKDNNYVSNGMATLNVINGIINKDVLVKMNGSFNNSGANSTNGAQKFISFSTNNLYYSEAKNASINFLNKTDSVSLVAKTVDLKKGGIYTMLLAGISPTVDAVVVDDSNMAFLNTSVPPSGADSVINIRFINLSPDVQPLSIRVMGGTTNEVDGLAYKGYSSFKAYTAKITDWAGTIGYSILTFQFVENGTVIKTYSLFVYYPNRFKNVALVLTGMKTPGSGQPSLFVSEMNYFQ